MKPKHQGGYTSLHAELCEQTLVTLLRGLGPWKQGVDLAGGLVPRYLISRRLVSEEPLLRSAIEILRKRFVSDDQTSGARKDGPNSYARFLADPGLRDLDARRRQDATAVVELFVRALADRQQPLASGDRSAEGI